MSDLSTEELLAGGVLGRPNDIFGHFGSSQKKKLSKKEKVRNDVWKLITVFSVLGYLAILFLYYYV